MSKFFDGLEKYIYWTSIPKIGLNDIVDILIVSVMIYLSSNGSKQQEPGYY